MALNDILTSMDGARDALVTAINAKGGSLADNATLYQCAAAVSNISTGTDTQEPVLLSPTNVTEETLALNTATNSYGTWNFSASNKASGYEPSALFMESYDNFTFGVESTHWLLVECTNTFAPESLYFYAGGSNVLGYTPKTLEIYGTSNGVEYLLGTATLVSTDQDANGLSNTVEATIGLDHGGRTYSSIKIIQTSNQTNTSVQAIWRKIEIRGYDTAVVTPCTAEYYKCASVDTGGTVIYGKTLVVSGAATSFYNGTYTLQDATATGYNRVWVHSNEEYALSYFASESTEGVSSGFWGFYKISDPSNADYSCKFNTENPWDNPTYISKTYEEEVLSIIHPTSTTGNTWSGYKAVFDSGTGTWSFESDVTEGLAYTSVTPIVGSIYSADALARIQSLYQGEPSGLIFRAPLASDLVDIVGGVQGESWGTAPVYGQIDGKDCVTTNGTGIKFTFDSAGLFEDIWSPRTIMLWFRKTGGSGWKQIYSPADDINIREADSTVYYGRYNQESTVSISNNVWYHHAFTVTENNIKWYIDGVLKTSNTSWTPSSLLTYFTLATWTGTVGNSPDGAWSGQIADVRIYNRVLDSAEIQQIYEA